MTRNIKHLRCTMTAITCTEARLCTQWQVSLLSPVGAGVKRARCRPKKNHDSCSRGFQRWSSSPSSSSFKPMLLMVRRSFKLHVHVRYMSSPVRLSAVCLQRSCTLLRRLKFSAMFLRHFVRWPPTGIQVKFYRKPSVGWLNATGVAEYSDFRPIEGYISGTVQDRR